MSKFIYLYNMHDIIFLPFRKATHLNFVVHLLEREKGEGERVRERKRERVRETEREKER